MMFRALVRIILWAVLAPLSTNAQSQTPFSKLGLREQRDFALAIKKIWILGERNQPETLLGVQAGHLQDVINHLQMSDDASPSELNRSLALAFESSLTVADRSVNFEQKNHWEPEFLSELYTRALDRVPPGSAKDFETVMAQVLSEIDKKVRWFESPLSPQPTNEFEEKLDSVIRQYLTTHPVRIEWKLESPEDWLLGTAWLEVKHSILTPEIENQIDLFKYGNTIDRLAEQVLDKEEFFHYRQALAQIEDSQWVTLKSESFSYFTLKDNGRRILTARLFPDLNFRTARALLEKRIEDVSEEERQMLFSILPDGDHFSLEWLNQVSALKDSLIHLKFHKEIVDSYLTRLKPDELPTTITLADGTVVPRIEKVRDDMRLLIASHQKDIDPGIYPRWLIEELMVRFYPTPEHLEQERARGHQETERQKLLDEHDRKTQSLREQLQSTKSLSESELLKKQLAEEQTALDLQLLSYPIDPDSDFQLLSAFNYGLTPHSASDYWRLTKVAGVGFAFILTARFAGARTVALVLATDAGIRVTVASQLDPNNLGFLDLDLTSRVWSPGLMMAQGLQSQGLTLSALFNPENPEQRLKAAHDLGLLVQESAAGLVVGGGSASLARLSRLQKFQKVRRLNRQIDYWKRSIERNQTLISEVDQLMTANQKRITELKSMKLDKTEEFTRLQNDLTSLSIRKDQLAGFSQSSRTKIGFYMAQVYGLSLQLLQFSVPWLKGKSFAKLPGERWTDQFRASRMRGIRHFENEIRIRQQKIDALEQNYLMTQNSPTGFLSPRAFGIRFLQSRLEKFRFSFKGFSQAQQDMAAAFSDAVSLSNTKDLPLCAQRLHDSAQGLARALHNFDQLSNLSQRPATLRWDEALAFKTDSWIQNPRGRTPVMPVEGLDANARFFAEQKLNLRDQMKSIQQVLNERKLLESELDVSSRAKFRVHVAATEIELNLIQKYLIKD